MKYRKEGCGRGKKVGVVSMYEVRINVRGTNIMLDYLRINFHTLRNVEPASMLLEPHPYSLPENSDDYENGQKWRQKDGGQGHCMNGVQVIYAETAECMFV